MLHSSKIGRKLTALIMSVVFVLCICAVSAPSADAFVYNEYYSVQEIKDSISSDGTNTSPVVSDVKIEDNRVARFDKVEITFDVDGSWENPYDYEDVQVDGVFTYPSGKKVTVPGFFMTPMVPVNKNRLNLHYSLSSHNYDPQYKGESTWCLRFSGDEVGKYSFYITVTDSRGKTSRSASYNFSCYEGGNKGYAMTSKSNPAYIVNSADGTVYYGTGSNIPWVRSQFTKNPAHLSYNYFVGKAKNYANMTRIWLCCWNWLEWTPSETDSNTWSYLGPGYYSQVMAASFDNVLELCEQAGLRVILCTDDNNEQFAEDGYGGWKYNPYNIDNGGTAKNTTDYWSNKGVREQYKKRIRYIIARWGYSSAIFSINLWNDMSNPSADTISYLKELRNYTHTLTDGWRPFYFGSNFNFGANAVLDYTTSNHNLSDGTKPSVTNECYSDANDFRNSLRVTIWSEFTKGIAATMIWSQDSVDLADNGKGCWDLFRHILDFTSDIPLDTSGKFKFSNIKVKSATASNADAGFQTVTSIKSYGDVSGWGQKATQNQFTVDTSVAGMNLPGYIVTLYGHKHTNSWKNPPTFTVTMPKGGKLIVGVTESSHGILQITVDGKVAATQQFINPETGTASRYSVSDTADGDGDGKPDKYTTVELSPGTHKIKLDNIGADWLHASHVYFVSNSDSPGALLTVSGMVSDSAAMVYLHNQTYDILATSFLGNEPTGFTNVKFTVDGLKENGTYAMYQFNPDTGEYGTIKKVTVSGGKVDITVPSVKRDYAVKLIKLDGEATLNTKGARYEYLQLVSDGNDPPDTPSSGNSSGNSSNPGGTNNDQDNNSSTDNSNPDNSSSSNTPGDSSTDDSSGGQDPDINTDGDVQNGDDSNNNDMRDFPWVIIVIIAVATAAVAAAFLILYSKRKSRSKNISPQ